jgi:hypothetical protein
MVNAGERHSDQAKPPEKGNGVKGAHWKLLCQLAEQNDTSDSIKQSFRKLKKARQLQDEDARRERARAREAKATQQKEDREAAAQMRAFTKDFYREHATWLRPRKKAAARSEAELRKLGGKKEMVQRKDGPQVRIIFGPPGETRFIYMPEGSGWRVALDAKPSLEEELKRVLNKSGIGLWNVPKPEQQPEDAPTEQKPAVGEDKQKGKFDIAVQAVDALLTCSRDWQDFLALPKSKQKKADLYRAMINVQLTILSTLQALKRDVKTNRRKLQVAFGLLEGKGTPSKSVKLCDHAEYLAAELQRPPTKKELKDRFDSTLPPQYPLESSEFSKVLKVAGLSWLKRGKRAPSW